MLSAAVAAAEEPAGAKPVDPIAELLAHMTLEEKAGQLAQWPGGTIPTGPHAAEGSEDDIRAGRVGSFLSVWGAEATARLQHIAVEESRMHVPLLFAADVIHGFRTIFPVPLGEAAAWDVELSEHCARAAAVEASAWGVHWTYAPMVDIARDARWGRVVEGAGEDPWLGSALAVARVRGFQNAPPGDPSALLATAKHFVAYGAAESGRDYNIVDISERTLREIYLPPFHAAVEAGVATIMPSFNELAGVPMHANRPLVRDLLRGAWGFDGIVISDYTGIAELLPHGVADSRPAAGRLGMDATVDIDMVSKIYADELPALVKRGQVPQPLVDAAVRRVLLAKQRLGLFEHPYRYSDPTREQDRTLSAETRALARTAGRESIVLLKNQGQLLPLHKNIGNLAVIGALADDPRAVLGNWNAIGRPEDAISVLAGIRAAVSPKTKVVYARGAAAGSDDARGFEEAERAVRAADVAVLVVGENEAMSGEASSRTFLGLPGAQQRLVERLQALGKPLVVVLMNGRPLGVSWLAEHVPALLESWYLGTEMGNSVADVLFGDYNPSGKLPISFPRSVGQVPIYYDHKTTGRPPSSEHYSSKYLDSPWTPLFPFGFGLSYTTFQYSAPKLSATQLRAADTLRVRVSVSNTGRRAGTEVVQLYLRDDVASVTRPVQTLRGFARIALEPGATRELEFVLDAEDFALLDSNFKRVVEPGMFTVSVGGSSAEVQSAHFELTNGATLKGDGPAIPRFMRKVVGARTQP
jgi:beta-glucosidase